MMSHNSPPNKRLRSRRGNIIVLYTAILALILIPSATFLADFSWLFMAKMIVQPEVDAAALVGANDLSRIVINDPSFGYVSLSNYPPFGKHTLAEDGQPLPVFGINALIESIRCSMLIGIELNNDTIIGLAKQDKILLDKTCQNLNASLSSAVSGGSSVPLTDQQGTTIDLKADVRKRLQQGLRGNFKIESLTVSNGWLNVGGNSTIRSEDVEKLNQTLPVQTHELPPFKELKCRSDSFNFAGVGATSTLCNSKNFQPADRKHLNSILRIDCVLRPVNPFCGLFSTMALQNVTLRYSATAQPYSNADLVPPGVVSVRFPGGISTSMQSWSDLISTNQFAQGGVSHYDCQGGDYPTDEAASLVKDESVDGEFTSASSVFAEYIYYWVRASRGKANLSSILRTIREPFSGGEGPDFFLYEVGVNGQIIAKNLSQDPFPEGVVSDRQSAVFADTTLATGEPCVVALRNEVKRQGTFSGGKHAGEPLAGYPLDWCERQEFEGSEALALATGKGSKAKNLCVFGDDLIKVSGARLSEPVRKSFYSGGLAEDIEIAIRGARGNH